MSIQDDIIYNIPNRSQTNVTKIKDLISGKYKDLVTFSINNQNLIINSNQHNNLNELQLLDDLKQIGISNVKMISSSIPTIQTSVSIQGMTCGACSASITESLESQPGIENASISLVTENGLITHSINYPTNQIISSIEDCGFDAQINKLPHSILKSTTNKLLQTSIGISGMTCGACSSSITDSIQQLEGVDYVSVSLITEEALIKHNPSITSEKLKEVIEDCGFDVTRVNSINSDESINKNEQTVDYEEVNLKIIGIDSDLDLQDLRYNIEAFIKSFPGIKDYDIKLLNTFATDPSQDSIVEDENDIKDLQSEMRFTYDVNQVGIRDVVDGLNNINENIEFLVFNSLDQSSASQLKLLSKIKDIQYWKNIFLQSLLLGIPVIILVHSEKTEFFKKLMIFKGLYLVTVIELTISTYIQFHLGHNFIKKFASFIRTNFKGASMDVLVCISTMVTYIFSLTSIIISVWNGRTENPPKVLFDTLVMLITFVSFGKLLENKAKGATSTALSSLLSLTPSICTIIDESNIYGSDKHVETSDKITQDFKTRNISIDLVQPNDIAIVLPGGKVPADGVIVFGESEIDESLITGEPLPVYKTKGDSVIGGSINGPHLIHMKVTTTGKKSQLHQIINLVKDSQVNKAPVQRFSDYIAARFVPAVMLLSIITFIIWSLICYNIHPDGLPMIFRKSENGKLFVCLQIAISVIVVACPCALGLAAPTAVMVGTGVGALNGVLIKGADILEKTTSINILLFDKTGTLTTGEMSLVKYVPILNEEQKLNELIWWKLIGSVECNSEHPIGKALTKVAKNKLGLTFEEDTFDTIIESLNVFIGCGIDATVTIDSSRYNISIGNIKMINEKFENILPEINSNNSNNTVVYVIIDEKYSGYIELSDSLKEGSYEVIDYLKNVEGYIVGMVTGDNKNSALKIGKEVGISENNIFYEVSPIHKDEVINQLKEKYGSNADVAFIGDGINDAPALAKADIGMAISSGTDIAIESADIVLIGNKKHNQTDLHGVINALKISNKTFARIKLNFIWAVIYNLFMLPFAMGCFLPFNLMLPPVAASIAMMISSISVVLSSLQLKWWKPPKMEKLSTFDDLEIGNTTNKIEFDLKNGNLKEFNALRRKTKNWNFSSVFKNRGRTRLRNINQDYELISGS
ncbi:CCC2 [Candida pseudojiufengensis]|uniref:CCC2 n=1 Tax=Candida pseudojiufengensis TaxID=497109 RepID=UPI002224494A|nr:CCC2 [Candida pseudojiufengensis]KAI5964102.1 CCC2 [Candida pseudojiufengensis]